MRGSTKSSLARENGAKGIHGQRVAQKKSHAITLAIVSQEKKRKKKIEHGKFEQKNIHVTREFATPMKAVQVAAVVVFFEWSHSRICLQIILN